MEVLIPAQAIDFDFNSARSSPFLSAPSTPKRFGRYYFSTPTSPTQHSRILYDFDEFSTFNNNNNKSPVRSSSMFSTKYEDEFAFHVTSESDETSIPAEELFDGGKIRALKPQKSPVRSSARSQGREKKDESTRERGRERSVSGLSSSSSRGRAARSVSPLRVSKYPWEEEEEEQQKQEEEEQKQSSTIAPKASSPSTTVPVVSSKGCRKWKLKDFFLFRSRSEGRAGDKDPLRKYTGLFRKHEDVKNASFRSLEGSNSGSSNKRRGQISAHEFHYTVNRAVSEDLKKKTFLPYKQGILGRLAFNPTVHALANGFGFSRRR
ncbi:uncharacterized protein LOC132278727 [Cornus florida]|uniref:uncharacterized protein LOC132278727 n=1 Tax=Cornus florida TaxID=4283 RepID=UPI00289ECA93|nr:uncharacterized protein LOC132278727 [Cornus florida]